MPTKTAAKDSEVKSDHPLTKKDPPKDPVKAGKAGETTDNPPTFPMAGMTIKGNEVKGKGETRLFQTAPDVKEYLTEAEAKEKGFFWKKEKEA